MSRLQRRQYTNRLALAAMYCFAVAALVPLSLVLVYTVANGLPAIASPDFLYNSFRPVGIPGGGVNHALWGTAIMVGLASVMALPTGIAAGVFLGEYPLSRWATVVRLAADVLVGTPSIAVGLLVYAALVAPFKHFSGFSGSAALAVLMLPVVVRTTDAAIALVPGGLREAGVALGLSRFQVSVRLILPAAVPGVVTGALLAVARAGGETAPLLFTAFGNRIVNFDPRGPMEALPLVVFDYARSPYLDLQHQAWGAALVLVALVLVVNLASRFVLRRQIALAGQT